MTQPEQKYSTDERFVLQIQDDKPENHEVINFTEPISKAYMLKRNSMQINPSQEN